MKKSFKKGNWTFSTTPRQDGYEMLHLDNGWYSYNPIKYDTGWIAYDRKPPIYIMKEILRRMNQDKTKERVAYLIL